MAATLALCVALGPTWAASAPAVAPDPVQAAVAQGDALAGAGQLAEAETLFRKAAEAALSSYGLGDTRTLLAVTRVGQVLMAQERHVEAEPILRQALESTEALHGPAHPETALAAWNLAADLVLLQQMEDGERLLRRALAIDEAAFGRDSAAAGRDLGLLAKTLDLQDRREEAEPLHRRVVAIEAKGPGERSRPYAIALGELGRNLKGQRRLAEAEALLKQAAAIEEGVKPRDPARIDDTLADLGRLAIDQGRLADAERLLRRRLELAQAQADVSRLADVLDDMGLLLLAGGHVAQAEETLRQTAAQLERVYGPDSLRVGASLERLAASLASQGEFPEAERVLRQTQLIYAGRLGESHPVTMRASAALANALAGQGQLAGAEALQRQQVTALEGRGGDLRALALALDELAQTLRRQGRLAEAEPMQRRALEIAEREEGPRERMTARYRYGLGLILADAGRHAEAEPLLRRSLSANEARLGRNHQMTLAVRDMLALEQARSGRFEAAARTFRGACRRDRKAGERAGRDAVGGLAGAQAGISAAACSSFQATSLFGWARSGGGPEPGDQPAALMSEAFLAAQRASISVAGETLSRRAARQAAAADGAEAQASAYEEALAARDAIDSALAEAQADPTPEGSERRSSLSVLRLRLDEAIPRLQAELSEAHPRYWRLRSPQPVSLRDIQARSGKDAALLRQDEALILFLIPAGQNKGLVFAVTKENAAWAEIPMTGEELADRVRRLRAQIDPHGYGVVGAGAGAQPTTFDRRNAYELYQALLGAPEIQAVVETKPTWMFVPSGPMTTLPPGVLVTAPPTGGTAGDADPTALRRTAWLLRSKAVSVLPTVAALRTLRQPLGPRTTPTEPLLAIADPDFGGQGAYVPAPLGPAEDYMVNGMARIDRMRSLPRLPGTRAEGLALLATLGGLQDGLLLGPDATETELKARNDSGRLGRVAVLEFATHGLLWGDMNLAEPSLALAAPAIYADAEKDDGLLSASDAASLRLNAEWVILSACNTAGPGGTQGEGLSGLAAAFFYAGARSLLASHWTVRDDVAPRLIPRMLSLERQDVSLSRAEALRRASLEVLDDPAMEAAHPHAWAPFVLAGEAGR